MYARGETPGFPSAGGSLGPRLILQPLPDVDEGRRARAEPVEFGRGDQAGELLVDRDDTLPDRGSRTPAGGQRP